MLCYAVLALHAGGLLYVMTNVLLFHSLKSGDQEETAARSETLIGKWINEGTTTWRYGELALR